jgi:hypothetical protein
MNRSTSHSLRTAAVAALLALTAPADLRAAAFSAGSNGSYGALVVTNNTTLPIPDNGVFQCTTILVGPGATLSFTPNALNSPVYLLAQSNVVVEGLIEVNGSAHNRSARGGPGGFSGGAGARPGLPPGDGHGPGGGRGGLSDSGDPDYAGNGSFGGVHAVTASTNHGRIYGNTLLVPLIGGSGGGGRADGNLGGGGGGAILIASDTYIRLSGGIAARGGVGPFYASGSGGGVRLVAPDVNGQSGYIDARSGNESWNGRVRIDRLVDSPLPTIYGVAAVGTFLSVFPAGMASLNIVEVAGTSIAEDAGAVAAILLPVGSATTQSVRILGRNFVGRVPIEVAVVPENTPTRYFTGELVAGADRTGTVTVSVEIPGNIPTSIYAWPK